MMKLFANELYYSKQFNKIGYLRFESMSDTISGRLIFITADTIYAVCDYGFYRETSIPRDFILLEGKLIDLITS